MFSRRDWLGLTALSVLTTGCEAIGLKATIVSSTTVDGKTKTTVREARRQPRSSIPSSSSTWA